MKNLFHSILVFVLLFLFVRDASGGGAIAQRRTMEQKMMQKKMIQQRMQQQVQQPIIQQKVRAQQQAVQKAVAQRVVAEQIKLQKQVAGQMAIKKVQAQKAQQRVMQNQMRAQVEQQLRNISLNVTGEIHTQFPGQLQGEITLPIVQVPPEEAKEVADFNDVVASLNSSGKAWPLIIDREAKEMVVAYYIDQYRRQGVKINKSHAQYAGMVDSMSADAPEMLEQPFSNILRIMAIIEYDFDNGQDKDNMALQILGSQSFQQNKTRVQQAGGQ